MIEVKASNTRQKFICTSKDKIMDNGKKSYDVCFKIRNSCFIRYYKCKDPIVKHSSEFSLHNLNWVED